MLNDPRRLLRAMFDAVNAARPEARVRAHRR
jgi:hypothetical protein